MNANRSLALAGGVVVGLSSLAMADTAPAQDLSSEVAQLRAEVAQLRADRGESWLNQRRTEEIKALVHEVLADADTRASLAGGGITAGHNGKKFFLADEDGKFLMNIAGRIQVRYIHALDNDSMDNDDSGFQIRRMKFQFDGYVTSPKFTYKVVIATNRDTALAYLEEAQFGYAITDQVTFNAGRFKAPFSREELTSSGKQLAVERSLVEELFTVGFTEGFGLTWQDHNFRVSGMFNDGYQEGEGPSKTNDYDKDKSVLAMTGRVDWRAMGNWKQMADFNAWSGEEMGLFFGAAAHYQVADNTNTALGQDGQFFAWTTDGSFEYMGMAIFGSLYGRHFSNDPNITNYDQYGAVAQVSYFVIPDTLEPFVRIEWYDLNGVTFVGNDDAFASASNSEGYLLTLGGNYYFKKHNAKVTADVVYSFNGIPKSESGLGIPSGPAGTIVFRTQFQLEF